MTFRYKVKHTEIPNFFARRLEITQWCIANVGEPTITWSYNSFTYRFRFKKNYVTFLLRWT